MNPISRLSVVICTCALFVGCGPATQEEIAVNEKAPPVVNDPQPGSPLASKPSAPLKFGFESTPASINQASNIELTVELTHEGSGVVELRIHTDPALDLNAGASALLALDSAGNPGRHLITVTPNAEGLHYIHVFGRLTDDSGLDIAKTYAIPVRVGESAERAATIGQKGEITYDINNQPIQSMPAEENDSN